MFRRRNSTCFFIVTYALLVSCAKVQEASSSDLQVPRIDQEHFQLTPNPNGYYLKISLPDGSYHVEDAKLINPGTAEQYLSVEGTNTLFLGGAVYTVTYTADKNGYKSALNYYYREYPPPTYAISIKALKASSG